jgi:hypothetical protein
MRANLSSAYAWRLPTFARLQGQGMAAWFAQDMANLHGMLATGYEDVVTDDVRAVTGTAPRTLVEFCRDFALVSPVSGR